MDFVKTKDGSYTAFNQKYQEHYHALSGAIKEAKEKFYLPAGIKNGMKILDLGFGLGYNTAVTIHNHQDLRITALENDTSILKAISSLPKPKEYEKEFQLLKKLVKKKTLTDSAKNIIELIRGNAIDLIYTLPTSYYDRIYFAPFSQINQPEIWCVSVFSELCRILHKKGKMISYPCGKRIKKNLEQVGFKIIEPDQVNNRKFPLVAMKIKGSPLFG